LNKTIPSPFTKEIVLTIGVVYTIAGIILYQQVGVWEMIRHVIVNGVMVFTWLWSAHWILRKTSLPQPTTIRYPVAELAWVLTSLILLMGYAANKYAGWVALPTWVYYLLVYGTVLGIFVGLRNPIKNMGLTWPTKSGWLAVMAVILINFAAGVLFQLLPPGEAISVPAHDLASQIAGPLSIFVLVAGLLFRAALPEELFFRVTLQPRLARFLPIGWAILLQAMLFMTAHLPQQVINYQRPLILALGYVLTVDNGLIGGYLWYRTRSLPLLIILHLLAYPRFGI